jgi:hypothetical protein
MKTQTESPKVMEAQTRLDNWGRWVTSKESPRGLKSSLNFGIGRQQMGSTDNVPVAQLDGVLIDKLLMQLPKQLYAVAFLHWGKQSSQRYICKDLTLGKSTLDTMIDQIVRHVAFPPKPIV